MDSRLIISFDLSKEISLSAFIPKTLDHSLLFLHSMSFLLLIVYRVACKSRVSNFTIGNDPFVRVGFPQHKVKPIHEPFPEVKKIRSEVTSKVSKRKRK